jgi:hypothetical protein
MTTQLHEDLITHLRHKLTNNVIDYVDIAKTMDIGPNDILAGAAEALITTTTSFCHTSMGMTAHEFAAMAFKLYTHFDEIEAKKKAAAKWPK